MSSMNFYAEKQDLSIHAYESSNSDYFAISLFTEGVSVLLTFNRQQFDELAKKVTRIVEQADRADREAEYYAEVMYDQMLSQQESLS